MEVSDSGVMLLSAYDKQQEEEADWLSGCLLLPRDALVSIKRRGLVDADAAKAYGVSISMMKYRMSMTGMNKQFRPMRGT
jgi:Zn-dependent peptidase ImmA (M78 family)